MLLAPEADPRRFAAGIEPGHRRQMGFCLGLQPVLLAPEGQLPVIVGRGRHPGPPRVVFGEPGRELIVGLDPREYGLRPLPRTAIRRQTHQSPRRWVGRVEQHRDRQMLPLFGPQSMRLAPERQPDVCRRIAADILAGRLISLQVGRRGRPAAPGAISATKTSARLASSTESMANPSNAAR